MRKPMHFAFFGSSLVSAYWNGAATYYRGLVRALAGRGHRVTFYEPDAYERQKHRDIDDPPWAEVVVYPGNDDAAALAMLERARSADVLVKTSGIGVYDALLEREVLAARRGGQLVCFLDVDAPATLARVAEDPKDAFRLLVPRYDAVFTYGGGDPVVSAYRELGARTCVPIYNALDPETHFPVAKEARFSADLSLLANRLPDREARVEEFFFHAARALPGRRFLLGGNGWQGHAMPPNVHYVGHVYTADHNALNVSALAVLNVARESMARLGYSPATRVFEAAGAGACIVTDAWRGIELFLEPGEEILVAEGGEAVAAEVERLGRDPALAARIGEAARRRVLEDHTYDKRAAEVEAVLGGLEREARSSRLAAAEGSP